MKYIFQIITSALLATSIVACEQSNSDRIILGRKHAQDQIKKVLADNTNKPFYDTLIKTKELAIAIAEPILFNIYGKEQIIEERPYECYLVDGYWYIAGTLPKNWKGGCFEIIINSKNAEILRLIHYK